ncbi:MAG: hypothetical protein EZS28_050254, partial [Streblomastix strix]
MLEQPYESIARIVLFVITFTLAGFFASVCDVNQFWLALETTLAKNNNPAVLLQYCRFLGNCGQGVVSLTCIVGNDYPEYYIVLLVLMGVAYALMGWNVDTHHASFAHVN